MSQHVYFRKYGYAEQLLLKPVPEDLGIIIVLPCFNESEIEASIQSLIDCDATKCAVELIAVVNSGIINYHSSLSANNSAIKTINACFEGSNSKIIPHIIHAPLIDKKHAGVGLARKIGMDEAARRCMKNNNPDGALVCFDADSTCSSNYLVELEKMFEEKTNGCSINFEHPLLLENGEPNNNIIDYEIHLRYYKNMLKYCDFPFPYHTIGSSMAVSTAVYLKQGGMNKRKAGEDFYFLHQTFLQGNFKELTTASIYPSARTSDRVPFGTGRAMMECLAGEKTIDSYHPEGFEVLKYFYNSLLTLHQTDYDSWVDSQREELKAFLIEAKLTVQLQAIQKKNLAEKQFLTQVYTYFDGFKVLKFLHYYRDQYQGNVSVVEAGNHVLNLNSQSTHDGNLEVLKELRLLDLQ